MKIRLNWIDYAKGLIIIWMVLYQCVTRAGYTHAHEGFVYHLAQFGSPLRMQSLFLISGLLFASSLEKNFDDFFRTRLAPLLYLFILWSFIAVILRTMGNIREIPYDLAHALFVKPLGSVWFIIILPLYMLTTWLCRRVSPRVMLFIALCLALAHIGPFSIYTDNFAQYFIYFLLGVYGKSYIAPLSLWFEQHRLRAALFVLLFVVVNLAMQYTGLSLYRGLDILLSLFAITAVIAFSLLLMRVKSLAFLQVIGQHSLVFYLGYTPFMLIFSLFLKTRMTDPSLYALILWCICLGGSFILWQIVKRFGLNWLYAKPEWLFRQPNIAQS